jgi:hypothetical protein
MRSYKSIEDMTLGQMEEYFQSIQTTAHITFPTSNFTRLVISDNISGDVWWDESFALVNEVNYSEAMQAIVPGDCVVAEIEQLLVKIWNNILKQKAQLKFPYIKDLYPSVADSLYYLKDRGFEVEIYANKGGFTIEIQGKRGNRIVYAKSHMHHLSDAIKMAWEKYKYQYINFEPIEGVCG